MKKILLSFALVCVLVACGSSSNKNGGGSAPDVVPPVTTSDDLGIIKIGETSPEKSIEFKNPFGEDAYFSTEWLGGEFQPVSFNVEGCAAYNNNNNDGDVPLRMPVGASCTIKYTAKPTLFARYDISVLGVFFKKSAADAAVDGEVSEKDLTYTRKIVKLIGSLDGTTPPPADIVYTFPKAGGEISMEIKNLDATAASSTYTITAENSFILYNEGKCATDSGPEFDCYELATGGTCVLSDRDVTVPQAGCTLGIKFIKGSDPVGMISDSSSSFVYLKPGVTTNTAVPRLEFTKSK